MSKQIRTTVSIIPFRCIDKYGKQGDKTLGEDMFVYVYSKERLVLKGATSFQEAAKEAGKLSVKCEEFPREVDGFVMTYEEKGKPRIETFYYYARYGQMFTREEMKSFARKSLQFKGNDDFSEDICFRGGVMSDALQYFGSKASAFGIRTGYGSESLTVFSVRGLGPGEGLVNPRGEIVHTAARPEDGQKCIPMGIFFG